MWLPPHHQPGRQVRPYRYQATIGTVPWLMEARKPHHLTKVLQPLGNDSIHTGNTNPQLCRYDIPKSQRIFIGMCNSFM